MENPAKAPPHRTQEPFRIGRARSGGAAAPKLSYEAASICQSMLHRRPGAREIDATDIMREFAREQGEVEDPAVSKKQAELTKEIPCDLQEEAMLTTVPTSDDDTKGKDPLLVGSSRAQVLRSTPEEIAGVEDEADQTISPETVLQGKPDDKQGENPPEEADCSSLSQVQAGPKNSETKEVQEKRRGKTWFHQVVKVAPAPTFDLSIMDELSVLSDEQVVQTRVVQDTDSDSALSPRTRWAESTLPHCYSQLRKMLLTPPLTLVEAAFEGINHDSSEDALLTSIITIFDANKQLIPLLRFFIHKEVQYTADSTTLFRTNNYATKLMKCYVNKTGAAYVQTCFQSSLNKLFHMDCTNMEIDPRKVPEGTTQEQIENNVENLKGVVNMFLQGIFDATPHSCPPGFRKISSVLAEEVSNKFPDKANIAVAGFLFLRFLVPSIVSPVRSGLCEGQPSREVLRTLILVSKVLQNLANGLTALTKEKYLEPLTHYMAEQGPKVEALLSEMGKPLPGGTEQTEAICEMAAHSERVALFELQKLMRSNIDKLGRLLVARRLCGTTVRSRDFVLDGTKQGFLKKTGAGGQGWRTRWFVLKGSFLYYFKTPQHSNSAGVIPLEDSIVYKTSPSSVKTNSSNSEKQKFLFVIETKYRLFDLQASSAKEREEWISAVRNTIAAIAKKRWEEEMAEEEVIASEDSSTLEGGSVSSPKLGSAGPRRHLSSGSSKKAKRSGGTGGSPAPLGVAKKGYLIKKGAMRKNWKRRWFILKDNMLLYYKNPKESIPLGDICIENTFVRENASRERPFCFELDYEGRTYMMEASSELDRRAWMKAIKEQKARYWKTQRTDEGHTATGDYLLGQSSKDTPRSAVSTSGNNYGSKPHLVKSASAIATRTYVTTTNNNDNDNNNNNRAGNSTAPHNGRSLASTGVKQNQRGTTNDGPSSGAPSSGPSDAQSPTLAWETAAGSPVTMGRKEALALAAKRALINPEKEGYLTKQGGTRKSWKRRWVVIHEGKLYYFKSPQDRRPLDVVNLARGAAEICDRETNRIEIITRARCYFFEVEKKADLKPWLDAINNSVPQPRTAASRRSGRDKTTIPQSKHRRKVGWLMKQGFSRSVQWRKRWIVLEHGLLTYYKTPHDTDPAGVIPLENSTVKFSSVENKEHCFELFTRYRNFFFMADNEVEASQWMEAIQEAKNSWKEEDGDTDDMELHSFRALVEVLSDFEETGASSEGQGSTQTSLTASGDKGNVTKKKKLSRISMHTGVQKNTRRNMLQHNRAVSDRSQHNAYS